ncbi:MAG: HEAT repeat domain-containing protein [Chloroflexi bacterium]|nr:HEAT repeat domain-containing protein [Chloroflexota bacterium]
MRKNALSSLEALNPPGLIDLLARALGDADRDVRRRAVDALSRLGGPRGIELLRSLLDHPDKGTSKWLEVHLRKLGEEVS